MNSAGLEGVFGRGWQGVAEDLGEGVNQPLEVQAVAQAPVQRCSGASGVAASAAAVCLAATGLTTWAASTTEDPRVRVVAAVAASLFGSAALVASCCALRLRRL